MSGAKSSRNAGLIWADVLDTASLNARPIARYLAAALCALAQDELDLIPSGFDLHETGVLGSLTDVNNETNVVPSPQEWPECSLSRPARARLSGSPSR
jgi:hypothetical protein